MFRTEPVRVHILVEKRIAPFTFDPVWGRTIWRGAIISFYQHFVPDGTAVQCSAITASCKQTVCLHYNRFLVFPFYIHPVNFLFSFIYLFVSLETCVLPDAVRTNSEPKYSFITRYGKRWGKRTSPLFFIYCLFS